MYLPGELFNERWLFLPTDLKVVTYVFLSSYNIGLYNAFVFLNRGENVLRRSMRRRGRRRGRRRQAARDEAEISAANQEAEKAKAEAATAEAELEKLKAQQTAVPP